MGSVICDSLDTIFNMDLPARIDEVSNNREIGDVWYSGWYMEPKVSQLISKNMHCALVKEYVYRCQDNPTFTTTYELKSIKYFIIYERLGSVMQEEYADKHKSLIPFPATEPNFHLVACDDVEVLLNNENVIVSAPEQISVVKQQKWHIDGLIIYNFHLEHKLLEAKSSDRYATVLGGRLVFLASHDPLIRQLAMQMKVISKLKNEPSKS